MIKRDRRRGLDTLSSNIERRSGREFVTKAKRELQIINEHKEKIKRLDSRAHLRQGREKQKLEEEQAYTLSLECFGFGKNKTGGIENE